MMDSNYLFPPSFKYTYLLKIPSQVRKKMRAEEKNKSVSLLWTLSSFFAHLLVLGVYVVSTIFNFRRPSILGKYYYF